MSFQPSPYSAGFSPVASRNPAAPESCAKHLALHKKYKKAMWKEKILTKKRKALEHKANAAKADYKACKAAGGDKKLNKITKTTSKAPVSSDATTVGSSESAAATAAAEAEAAGGGNLPLVAFGVVTLAIVGGGAYFMFGGKKHKKKHILKTPPAHNV